MHKENIPTFGSAMLLALWFDTYLAILPRGQLSLVSFKHLLPAVSMPSHHLNSPTAAFTIESGSDWEKKIVRHFSIELEILLLKGRSPPGYTTKKKNLTN